MSDETNDVTEEVIEAPVEDAPKASAKKKAVKAEASVEADVVVDEVAQDEVSEDVVEAIQEAVADAVDGELKFSPGSYTFSPYNMWNPWVTAQKGDLISYNTNVNSYDWAGAVVFQNGQYNTTQRGF